MAIRFRRSMKLLPGVRLSVNKDSVGMSFGVPGARWLRCDAMVQLYTEGSFNKQYLKWQRSLYLDDGFLEVPFF